MIVYTVQEDWINTATRETEDLNFRMSKAIHTMGSKVCKEGILNLTTLTTMVSMETPYFLYKVFDGDSFFDYPAEFLALRGAPL